MGKICFFADVHHNDAAVPSLSHGLVDLDEHFIEFNKKFLIIRDSAQVSFVLAIIAYFFIVCCALFVQDIPVGRRCDHQVNRTFGNIFEQVQRVGRVNSGAPGAGVEQCLFLASQTRLVCEIGGKLNANPMFA